MKKLKILLIGQPNVGKSSLMNALVGPKVTVSNYPGTTVEITKARKQTANADIEFIDTPGIYSISSKSEEEKVTEKELFNRNLNGIIVIADAMSLERSLYLVLQILETGIPAILALNFIEDALQIGTSINCTKLAKLLNVPVIPINPLTQKGIDKLVQTVLKIRRQRAFKIKYENCVEKQVSTIAALIKKTSAPKFIALKVLEGDSDFDKYLKNRKKIIQSVNNHNEISKSISITRYGVASFMAKEVTQTNPSKQKRKWQEKVDNILLHKITGPIITGAFLLITFGILLYLGSLVQSVLTNLMEQFVAFLSIPGTSTLIVILLYGFTGLVAGISIALPYVLLFYLILGLLEDIGLLPRFIVNIEQFLKKLGLSGKAFIPLVLGLGCTVPAIRATRILSNKKEQFRTAALFAFVPCSSRIAIIMGIVAFYGGLQIAISLYATLFAAGLVWALIIKKMLCIKSKPLLLELPPYRKPLIRNVFIKGWIRMKDFVYITMPLLMAGGIVYGIMDTTGFINIVVKFLSPIAAWLGLPATAVTPLIFGFLQKDLTGAMLTSAVGNDISLILNSTQIFTFGIASSIGIPCIAALGILIKEFGFKKAIILTITSIAYGLLLAGLAWRIIAIIE